ncbi:MAG: DNA-processing protein DprA [Christensenella sp.]|uniref:DNA-processing protein DprA n=1 Tax=Christensenella sp. TaxID=1935934 RepID=UPI002B2203C3|nr:DNA-processing protein DprA [Christensenella sp.]MEA5002142.1 DNA-processing protein DprA [Christensenella sp.]
MTEITREEKYWVWLASSEGIGPVRFYSVLNAFTDLGNAWDNCKDIARVAPGITEKQAAILMKNANDAYVENILALCEKKGIRILTRLHQDYPHTLAEIENPPPVLYYKGDIPEFDDMSCGIVGSRRPTRNGFDMAREVSSGLAAQGVVIVSGMALGIDTAAHVGALDAKGKTVAVLGCGADVIYPKENRKLYDAIIENGAVISELLPGTEPKAQFFPQRNRIVSGLSRVLIAGEGGERSGARITVDDALTQGREVYTLACDLKSPMAKLPLYLMDAGAMVVHSALDVMNDQGWEMSFGLGAGKKQKETNKLDLLQAQIYNLLLKEVLSAEQIAQELDIAVREANTVLTVMELSGLINGVPGDKFRINS